MRWLGRKQRRRGLRPRDAAVLIVAVWLVAVIIFGIVEHLIDDQTFPTVWLGMWWALATVTTVGYGDVVPQDPVGRVVASFLLLGGLALISVLTATITSGFVARAQRETPSSAEAELLAEIRELRAQVEDTRRAPRAVTGPLRAQPAAPTGAGAGPGEAPARAEWGRDELSSRGADDSRGRISSQRHEKERRAHAYAQHCSGLP